MSEAGQTVEDRQNAILELLRHGTLVVDILTVDGDRVIGEVNDVVVENSTVILMGKEDGCVEPHAHTQWCLPRDG